MRGWSRPTARRCRSCSDRSRYPGRARGASALAARQSRDSPPVGSGVGMLRFLLWRSLALLAFVLGGAAVAWLLRGGPGELLREGAHATHTHVGHVGAA